MDMSDAERLPDFEALDALLEGRESAPRADPSSVEDRIQVGRSAPWEGLRTLRLYVDLRPTVAGTRLTAYQLELSYTARGSVRTAKGGANALEGHQIIARLTLNGPDRGQLKVMWRVSAWVKTGFNDGGWWVKEGTIVAG